MQVASAGCAPDLYEKDSPSHYCERSNYIALKTIKMKPEIVVLKYNKARNCSRSHQPERNKLELLKHGVEDVLVVGPYLTGIQHCRNNAWVLAQLPSRTFVGIQHEFKWLDDKLEELLQPLDGVTYVSAINLLCNEKDV